MSKRVLRRGWSCIPCVNLWRNRPLCFVVEEAIGECSRVVCCLLPRCVEFFYVHFIAEWMLYRNASRKALIGDKMWCAVIVIDYPGMLLGLDLTLLGRHEQAALSF
jgi:hypothetical protein